MLKFSCEKTLLQQAVSTVSRAVAAKSSIPALEGVLLEGDTQLTLSGYNMQTGIRTAISAEIHQEGRIVLNARLFGEMIRRLPDDIVVFSADEKYVVKLVCGDASFELPGLSADDYPELPTVDDEFAKDVSEFDTLKDLKADIKKKLTAERTESAQRAFEDVLMAKVAEGIEADIPEEMVELQAERMMEQFKQQLASQGIPFDQYLKMTNTAEADFRKQAQGPAADQVKMDLAVEAIIKAEGLEASDEDVESEMKSVAEKYGMDLDTVKKYLRPEDVKEQVIREKVVKLVADSAVAVAPAEEKAELEAEGEVVEKKAAKKAPAKKPAKKDAEKDAE